MGTNFYIRNTDGTVNMHIGKRSCGWVFLMHGYLEPYDPYTEKTLTLTRVEDVIDFCDENDYYVVDENGEEYTGYAFASLVRSWGQEIENYRRHTYSILCQHRKDYDVLYGEDFS